MNVQPHSPASTPSSSASHHGDDEAGERIGRARFRRMSRLLRHADFQRVYKLGRRHFGTHMTVFYLKREIIPAACYSSPEGPHIGFTVGRVLGGAVDRNRIKRRMREAVRANLGALTVSVDVVINPKKSAQTVDISALRNEVARAFAVIQEKETKSKR